MEVLIRIDMLFHDALRPALYRTAGPSGTSPVACGGRGYVEDGARPVFGRWMTAMRPRFRPQSSVPWSEPSTSGARI